MAQDPAYALPTYTLTARIFHWLMALLIVVQIPVGLCMSYRGNVMLNDKGEVGVWDELTNTLYSSHKLIGLSILALIVLRLAYRLTRGAPPADPSVPDALKGVSHLVHWSLYLLLLLVPIGGYLAVSYGDYLDVFNFKLPALTVKNEDMSKEIFTWHAIGAFLIIGLVTVHILAAIYHRFIRRDRVVERMLPRKYVA